MYFVLLIKDIAAFPIVVEMPTDWFWLFDEPDEPDTPEGARDIDGVADETDDAVVIVELFGLFATATEFPLLSDDVLDAVPEPRLDGEEARGEPLLVKLEAAIVVGNISKPSL